MRRTLAATVAVAAVGLAGCGGSPDGGEAAGNAAGSTKGGSQGQVASPVQAVQAAYSKTTGRQSAKIDLKQVTQLQGQKNRVSAEGVVDFKKSSAKMTMDLPQGSTMKLRKVGKSVYMQFPPRLRKRMPGNKAWFSLTPSKLAGKQGAGIYGNMGNRSAANPAGSLSYLRGVGEVSKVGNATVDGVQTTRYKAKVDLDKAAKKVGAQRSKLLNKVKKHLGTKTIPTHVWVDDQDRVRQQKVNLEYKLQGKKVNQKTTVKFSDFGTNVNVSAPPKGKTTSLQGAMKQAQQQTQQQGQQGQQP